MAAASTAWLGPSANGGRVVPHQRPSTMSVWRPEAAMARPAASAARVRTSSSGAHRATWPRPPLRPQAAVTSAAGRRQAGAAAPTERTCTGMLTRPIVPNPRGARCGAAARVIGGSAAHTEEALAGEGLRPAASVIPVSTQASAPTPSPTIVASSSEPLATVYATTMSGSVTSADACCAAAALVTRAEILRMRQRASAMNGGSTQNIRINQFVVGKNQPPTFGPTSRLTIKV